MRAWVSLLVLLLAVCCGLSSAYAAGVVQDTMAQRLQACTACHGAQGQAGPDGYYPRLAGKPAGYLYQQLLNFRAGRRHYPLMQNLLDALDAPYLLAIAKHFADQDVPYPPPRPAAADAAEMARGELLVRRGRSAQGLPACVDCHGPALMGVNPGIPALLGLPADYLNAQMGGWQTGQRRATSPDCMATIAAKLSASDISAIARWLSAQAVPAHAHAAEKLPPHAPTTPDLQCGSMVQSAPTLAAAGEAESEVVARGRYLARIGNCALCHTARGGDAYAGGRAIETPFGAVYAGNITPDATHGLGRWTADDFWNAMHHGLSRDGHALYPAFPYTSFTHIQRADADALWAYLKSVPPQPTANRPHALRWPFNTSMALRVWRLLFFSPVQPPASEARADALQRGRYLVEGAAHCMECHAGRNALGARTAAGGQVLPGVPWFAPSLADAAQASVAAWSEDEIADFLQTGRNRRAQASGPMAEVVLHGTQYLTSADALAMAKYLKSLAQQTVALASAVPAASPKSSKLYADQCADCHGARGEGFPNAYPALAGNRAVTMANSNNLVLGVLGGGFAPATHGNPQPFGMPPFQLRLGDSELAAVLSYIRSAWGNQAAPVSEFDINKLRRSQVP